MARVFAIISLSVVILLAGIFSYLKVNNRAVSADTSNIMFTIKDGDSLVNISKNLESKSLIRNKYSFLFYAYTLGLNKKIQAGTFRLSPSLSTKDLIVKLSKGGVSDYWLKIIEGTRVEENDVKNAKEGYLFPDSYLIPTYYTADQILQVIQSNFDKKFAQAKEGATNKKLTDKEIVIFASILEREARSLKSKQEVAGILLNRLEIGMALQVDASVQYARDTKNKPKKYWEPLSKADISIISPFNTYKNPGLLPSPICNPGYDAIYAAFHPTASNYLYYITGNDNLMHYAVTLDQHNSNIANYLK
ncbi:MAG TPA: endolytic transglycosylase MltG [Candidatus Woesebacteria bacterium]|nr:endolytic transglycosylase MltG [Candidatus Woesebacteria bacterium]